MLIHTYYANSSDAFSHMLLSPLITSVVSTQFKPSIKMRNYIIKDETLFNAFQCFEIDVECSISLFLSLNILWHLKLTGLMNRNRDELACTERRLKRPLPGNPTPTSSSLRCSNTYRAHFFTNFSHFDVRCIVPCVNIHIQITGCILHGFRLKLVFK